MAPETPAKSFSDREAELLVHCARLDITPERAERIKLLAGSELNWTRLMSLAHRNGLWPLVFFHLNRIAPEQASPDFMLELRNRFQSNGALNVIMTAEMIRLLELFEQNQIPALPYKGPAIAVGVYRNLSLRQFADLDILVPEDKVWQATELLKAQGYQAHFVIPKNKQPDFLRLSYVRLFKRDSDNTTVELHWRLAPRFFGVTFDTGKLWRTARTIPMQRANVRFPRTEDFVLMLCIHGAKDLWEKLEWICGLAELIRADPQLDWQELLASAQRARCFKTLSLGLTLARDLLEAAVPHEVMEKLAGGPAMESLVDKIVARYFADEPIPFSVANRIKFHLKVKDSLPDKVRYCSRLALTTTPVDWEVVSLPQPVSFVYYPLRLLRLFKKYGRQSDPLPASNRSIGPV